MVACEPPPSAQLDEKQPPASPAVGGATATPAVYAPAPVREPPVPMLSHLERTLPRGEHWRYEPKLDGFRGLLWHGDGATVQLLSRNVKDLSAWFPEVVQA